MHVYALAWDFFKMREMLGLSVVSSSPDDLKIIETKKGGTNSVTGTKGGESDRVNKDKEDKDDVIEKGVGESNEDKEKEGGARAC